MLAPTSKGELFIEGMTIAGFYLEGTLVENNAVCSKQRWPCAPSFAGKQADKYMRGHQLGFEHSLILGTWTKAECHSTYATGCVRNEQIESIPVLMTRKSAFQG